MIGQNIGYYRKIKGMKQNELAKIIGVTPQTISVWEKGTIKPSANKYQVIAQALGVNVLDLIGTQIKPVRKGTGAENIDEIVEAAIRLRHKEPKIIAMLSDAKFSDEDIRAFAAILKKRGTR